MDNLALLRNCANVPPLARVFSFGSIPQCTSCEICACSDWSVAAPNRPWNPQSKYCMIPKLTSSSCISLPSSTLSWWLLSWPQGSDTADPPAPGEWWLQHWADLIASEARGKEGPTRWVDDVGNWDLAFDRQKMMPPNWGHTVFLVGP